MWNRIPTEKCNHSCNPRINQNITKYKTVKYRNNKKILMKYFKDNILVIAHGIQNNKTRKKTCLVFRFLFLKYIYFLLLRV